MAASALKQFARRLVRASRLDRNVYEEVEADPSAMGQSLAIVLLSSAATVLGGLTQFRTIELFNAALLALIGWILCGLAAYVVGTRVLPEPQTRADFREVLRVTGLSNAPGVFRIAGLIPKLGSFVYVVTGVWMLVAMVVAIRQTLDYQSTWRALAVAVIAWALFLAVTLIPAAFGVE